jgi:hypothetical protein
MDIADVLNELKFDKMKPVREASQEAMNALKYVPDSELDPKRAPKPTDSIVKTEVRDAARTEVRKPRTILNTDVREVKEVRDFSQERQQPSSLE